MYIHIYYVRCCLGRLRSIIVKLRTSNCLNTNLAGGRGEVRKKEREGEKEKQTNSSVST